MSDEACACVDEVAAPAVTARAVATAVSQVVKIVGDIALKKRGVVGIDYGDVVSVFQGAETAAVGVGRGGSAAAALEDALSGPSLKDVPIKSAKAALIHVVAGEDFTTVHLKEITASVKEAAPVAKVICGTRVDDSAATGGEVEVTLIVTGF